MRLCVSFIATENGSPQSVSRTGDDANSSSIQVEAGEGERKKDSVYRQKHSRSKRLCHKPLTLIIPVSHEDGGGGIGTILPGRVVWQGGKPRVPVPTQQIFCVSLRALEC